MRWFDKLWIGILIGLILPCLFAYIYIQQNYHGDLSLESLIRVMTTGSMIVKFIFIATLPNMFAVFLFNTFEFWRVCRGIFVSIWLYIILCIPFLA